MESTIIYAAECRCGLRVTVRGVDQLRARQILARHFRQELRPAGEGVGPVESWTCEACASQTDLGA